MNNKCTVCHNNKIKHTVLMLCSQCKAYRDYLKRQQEPRRSQMERANRKYRVKNQVETMRQRVARVLRGVII